MTPKAPKAPDDCHESYTGGDPYTRESCWELGWEAGYAAAGGPMQTPEQVAAHLGVIANSMHQFVQLFARSVEHMDRVVNTLEAVTKPDASDSEDKDFLAQEHERLAEIAARLVFDRLWQMGALELGIVTDKDVLDAIKQEILK